MVCFGIIGIISIIGAILFYFFPKTIVTLNEWGKKVFFTDEVTIKYRLRTGTILLLAGIFLIYIWVYLIRHS